ncbi:MAG TPA: hypothetical protein VFZ32_06180 [Micromonosporaceae bacterium]
MRLTWRDGIATLATAAAVVFYGLWLTDTMAPNLSTRMAALVVFILGFAGCPTAASDLYTRESRVPLWYTVAFSVVGFVALVAGVISVVFASEVMLATLVFAMVALWFAATLRRGYGGHRPARSTDNPLDAAVQGPHPTF